MALTSVDFSDSLERHLQQEWLLTNGIGAFAGSTAVGCNTRRYHGLLVAATLPPVGRVMTVNRIGEILSFKDDPDHSLEFSINQFDGRFHPRGDQYLRRLELDGSARFTYDVEGIAVVKHVLLAWGKNLAAVRYTVTPPPGRPVTLQLLPFVSLRDFHATRHAEGVHFGVHHDDRHVTVSHESLVLHLHADGGTFAHQPDWWYGHTYAVETDRGLDDHEDLFNPGRYVIECDGPTTITVWFALEATPALDFDGELSARPDFTRPLNDPRSDPSPAVRRLLHAAADFVVARSAPDGSVGATILAGYPWFADWGRDTMIALPGLLLCTGRFEAAKHVLTLFAQYVSEGMIPNRFDDYTNEPSYNTVDASLWFIHAVHEYRRITGDEPTHHSVLRPACQGIIDGYRRGTRYNIHMDESDGLIIQGDATTQLTWMDAKCGGVVFTPRQGKAVEINALWHHALRLMGDNDLADRVAESFRKTFWISPFRGLADVVDGDRRDTAVRPNQIFAVGLPNSPLDDAQQRAVVEVVRRELLTPMGLRTLGPSDPNFHPLYHGPQRQRDEAYHNGTIWAWPMGSFIDAHLKVNRRSPESIAQGRAWLQPLVETMTDTTLNQIAEIFEARPPHRAVGCPAQAWSVAEVLRAAMQLRM